MLWYEGGKVLLGAIGSGLDSVKCEGEVLPFPVAGCTMMFLERDRYFCG